MFVLITCESFSSLSKDWLDLFDLVVTDAKKPGTLD